MKCNQHDKACNECPFSRKCTPGSLGGSHPGVYLGQILGPFFLPCHMPQNYKGNDTQCTDEHAQCVGAAIFRRKLGVKVPDPLLKSNADDSNVFNTLEEFLAHHCPGFAEDSIASLCEMARAGIFTQMEMMKAAAIGKSPVPAKEAQLKYTTNDENTADG